MFQSLDQLIEEAFIRAFPGKAQEAKQVYRYELEAMVDAAATALAMQVAASDNYRWLQQSLVLPLNQGRTALTFPPAGQMHPTSGARTGLTVVENRITPAAANVYGTAAGMLAPDATGNIASCAIEWGWETVPELLVLVRPLRLLDAVPLSVLDTQNACAVSVDAAGNVVVMQSGSTIGAVPFTVLASQRLRLSWGADGVITLYWLDASNKELSSVALTSVEITEPCGLVFVFPNAATRVLLPTLVRGLEKVVELPADNRFLLNTIVERGTVQFENPSTGEWYAQPLTFLEDDNYQMLPRLQGLWYWSFGSRGADGVTGTAIRLYPGDRTSEPPSNLLRVTGNVIPTWADIPNHLHDALIEQLVAVAQRRTVAGANVVQKVKR